MVGSVRKSVGEYGYEIILVDGGSTDTTLDWCKRQHDIVLIEQGKLLGAIKAFNAGCAAARGDFVVLLNDDIEVVGNAIAKSVHYLEEHPEVGQVAFENMVDGGRRPQFGHVYGYLYGQCSTTRKHLGDLVGWWGDEGMKTYGGDTRLSAALWELGWSTVSVKGCAILDHMVDDTLRQTRRAELGGTGNGNTDTKLFHNTWRNRLPRSEQWIDAAAAPLHVLAKQGMLRTLRFKIVPTGGDPRTGLINAFGFYGPATQLDQSATIRQIGLKRFQNYVIDETTRFKPHLVMFQVQGGTLSIEPETTAAIRQNLPGVVLTNFDGDFRPELHASSIGIAQQVDYQLISTPSMFERYRKSGCDNLIWWLNGFEPVYGSVPREVTHRSPDVVFLANVYHGNAFPEADVRANAVLALRKAGIRTQTFGNGWARFGISARFTGDNHALNTRIYATAKMGLSISATSQHYGYTSDRLFMVTASGCPVLVQRFVGMEELGYVDGETCIAWSGMDELVAKARYYAAADDERELIGKRGRDMTHSRHNYVARVHDLLNMISAVNPRSV